MMKLSLLGIVVPLISIWACQAPESGPLSDEDISAIESASDEWAQAIGAADAAAATATLTQDAVLMPSNGPSIQGTTAIQAFLEKYTETDFSVMREEIDGRGDLAYERADYAITLPAEEEETPTLFHGKYLTIWKKQADGSWLIAVNIWNFDEPPSEPKSVADETQVD